MSRAFSASDGFGGHEPRALPWAGMNDAFGVSFGVSKCAHNAASFWPEEFCLAPLSVSGMISRLTGSALSVGSIAWLRRHCASGSGATMDPPPGNSPGRHEKDD